VTRATVNGTLSQSGWYGSAVVVTLSAADSASGVRNTSYSLASNGGAPSGWSSFSTPLVLAATGTYELRYFSVDNAGNVEPMHLLNLSVDLADTSTTFLTAADTTLTSAPTAPFQVTISDPAGVMVAYASLDGGPEVPMSLSAPGGATTSATYELPTAAAGNGVHLVTIRAVNALGQSTSVHEAVVVNVSKGGALQLVAVLSAVAAIATVGAVMLRFFGRRRNLPPEAASPKAPTGSTVGVTPYLEEPVDRETVANARDSGGRR
jgi:hypothetical protein